MQVFLPILAITILSAWAHPASAADLECMRSFDGFESYPHSKIDVDTIETDIAYVSKLNRAQLTRLASGNVLMESGSQLNGLTVANMKSLVGAQLSVSQGANGLTCVWPASVTVRVGYPTMKVYVVNEYDPGSCEQKVTMEHEIEHVKINASSLASHIPRIRRSMERKISIDYPKRIPPGQDATGFVVQDLSSYLDKYVSQMSTERDGRHSHLDSPDSYSYWQSLCDDW